MKELSRLRAQVIKKNAQVDILEQTVRELRQSLEDSESKIQSLVEKLHLAHQKRYGSSSESIIKNAMVVAVNRFHLWI